MADEKDIDNDEIIKEVPDEITMGMTGDEAWAVIKKRIEPAKTIKEINDFIQTLHPSSRYIAIRDYIGRSKDRMIRDQRYLDNESVAEYQRYQQLKEEADKSYKHDQTPVKMIDLDTVSTKVYELCLKMIKTQQDEINELYGIIDKMQKAINAVERETEIEPTEWHPELNVEEKVEANDNHSEEDVQGEQESI